jgi:Predicted sugar phosphatases of the HAD superfamily
MQKTQGLQIRIADMDWSQKRCVVLDMDGTVYLGHIPIAGAVRFIQQHWGRLDFYFLSNNTSKSPLTYVDKLNGMGIAAREDLLLSPVTPLVDFLRSRGILRVFSVGNADFQHDLQRRMRQTGWLQRMLAPLLFCICKIANHIAEFFAPPASAITALDEVCMMVAGIAPERMRECALF